jgi:hypothetical protein
VTSHAREGSSGFSSAAFAPRALALAGMVAIAFYAVAGLAEAALIRVLQPSELELDWISDAVLSSALGIALYLWLHLRAARLALTEHESSCSPSCRWPKPCSGGFYPRFPAPSTASNGPRC